MFFCTQFSMNRLVCIENLTDPNSQRFLRGHDMPVSALTVSPSGKYIASSQLGTTNYRGYSCPIFVWDSVTCDKCMVLKGLVGKANKLAFSPDERFLCGIDSVRF